MGGKLTSPASTMEENNGFVLAGHDVPDEVLTLIFARVPPRDLLNCRRVCRAWNDLVQSPALWRMICDRRGGAPHRPDLPWHVICTRLCSPLFERNLLRNVSGEHGFDSWVIKPVFSGDGFIVEQRPEGAQPLPVDVADFGGRTSCFATSFGMCSKQQIVKLTTRPALRRVFNEYRPTIIASDWYAPRFDCSCMYRLAVNVVRSDKTFKTYEVIKNEQAWTEGVWQKVELIIDDYPEDIDYVVFIHEGHDLQFWKGHYGSKMAGACLKFTFDKLS